MKAYEVQQFGIENLALVERDEPEVTATQVLVRFRAASLNFRDLMVASGTYNPRMKMPAVPLSDGAGEVVAIGDSVTKWKVGARVISTTSSEEKIERLHQLGADDVINYRSREDWDAAVMELTDKRGVDHVVEVGGAGTLGKSISSVRLGGHVAMIGALSGPGD